MLRQSHLYKSNQIHHKYGLFPLTIVSNYFVDWDTNEPAGGSSENCLVLGYDGKLKSASCQLFSSFNAAACEIRMVTSTEATVTGNFLICIFLNHLGS